MHFEQLFVGLNKHWSLVLGWLRVSILNWFWLQGGKLSVYHDWNSHYWCSWCCMRLKWQMKILKLTLMQIELCSTEEQKTYEYSKWRIYASERIKHRFNREIIRTGSYQSPRMASYFIEIENFQSLRIEFIKLFHLLSRLYDNRLICIIISQKQNISFSYSVEGWFNRLRIGNQNVCDVLIYKCDLMLFKLLVRRYRNRRFDWHGIRLECFDEVSIGSKWVNMQITDSKFEAYNFALETDINCVWQTNHRWRCNSNVREDGIFSLSAF